MAKRVTNQDVIERVLSKRSADEVTLNDIGWAYAELRSEAAGGDHWMKFGSAVRGGGMLNGMRAEREEKIADMIAEIAEKEEAEIDEEEEEA